MKTAGLLLAAGASRRFGAEDKLLAPFEGKPLVSHAAEALRQANADVLIAVTGSDAVAGCLAGFTIVRPIGEEVAQSRSLAAGVAEAMRIGADRLLVVLGDMPRITPDLCREVMARCGEAGGSAAFDGKRPQPPACFSRALYPDLARLTGDRGAGTLLRTLPQDCLVHAPPGQLADIDTTDDLARLEGPGRAH